MPKCNKCDNMQSRLNKGALCKECFRRKINPAIADMKDNDSNINVNETTDSNYQNDLIDDRNWIELIKDSMTKERMWNEDMQTVLKAEVDFLKKEMIIKNSLIERLMVELHENNPKCRNTTNDECNTTISTELGGNTIQPISSSLIDNHNKGDTAFTPNGDYVASEIAVNNKSTLPAHVHNESSYNNFVHPNRYELLNNENIHACIDDEYEYAKDSICEWAKQKDIMESRRPQNVINKHPENDVAQFNQPRIVPRNSTYAQKAGHRRKILILSDSTLRRLQMRLFNNELKNGHAYRKYHPGATPIELAHYALLTLEKDTPDVVIINAGTNSLPSDDTLDIGNDIFNLVNICHQHGVREVHVSGIIFGSQYASKVRELNNYIESKKSYYNFTFINNDNILPNDIGNDKLHLNFQGIVKIANNILHNINTLPIS